MEQISTDSYLRSSKDNPGINNQQGDLMDPYEGTTITDVSINGITPTSSVATMNPLLTDRKNIKDSETVLYDSFTDPVTPSTQFPMQHATKLQSETVSLGITTSKDVSESALSVSALDSRVTTSASNDSSRTSIFPSQRSSEGLTASKSSSSSSSPSYVPTAIEDSGTTNAQSVDDVSELNSSYEQNVIISELNSATGFVQSSTSNVLTLTSMDNLQSVYNTDVFDSSKEVDIKVSHSDRYVPSTGDLYSPVTASKTVVATPPVAIDTSSFKSTSAIPLTPSGKPVNSLETGGTALFGGGFTDYILYIGVPACGLVILVFLIICVVCLKKRKNKHKGSPTKNHVQDLWVNSQLEIPLTSTRDPLQDIHGGVTVGGHRDLVLRRRKKGQRIKIKGKNALELLSQTWKNEEEVEQSCLMGQSHDLVYDSNRQQRTESNQELETSNLIKERNKNALNTEPSTEDLDTALDDLDYLLDMEDDSTGDDLDNNADYEKTDQVSDDEVDTDEGTLTGDEENDIDDLGVDLDHNCTLEGCIHYEAVFDFQAELETHLTLKQGDLVQVHRKESNGWWRGTVGDHTGWFPSNYVQAAPQDKLETENEIEMHSESNVSSFMVQPRHPSSLQDSLPSEKDIEVEPIYCKIQPKEKRKSFPKVQDKSLSKLPNPSRDSATTPIEDVSKYIAIYSYGGHFTGELTIHKGDIIQGKQLDRNGWMKGVNETTNLEGWCPVQYVDKLDKDEIQQLEPSTFPTSESQNSLSPDPLTYKQLDLNKTVDGMKDWVGIMHKAIHTFNAEKAGDLEFEVGDLITVFQVLENGWWLGSKGKSVGWFPGSCVTMIPQPSPRISNVRSAVSHSSLSQSPDSPVSSDESKSVTDNGSDTSPSKSSKVRPVRKAPPPPIRVDGSASTKISSPSSPKLFGESESKIPTPTLNKTPKLLRPTKAAPPRPPVKNDFSNDDPLYEALSNKKTELISDPVLIQTTRNDELYDLIQHPSEDVSEKQTNGMKPEVPKRYIKPTLVKIPRNEINIPSTAPPNGRSGNSCIARPKAPPPPRPIEPPKKPLDPKNISIDQPKTEIMEPDTEDFFLLPPQHRLAGIPMQDLLEPDMDTAAYEGVSSFGSSFGSTFGKKDNNNQEEVTIHSHESHNDRVTNSSPYRVNVIDKEVQDSNEKEIEQDIINFNKETVNREITESDFNDSKISEKGTYNVKDNVSKQTLEDKSMSKKEKPVSRIQPPKQIPLSRVEHEKTVTEKSPSETIVTDRQTPRSSRIPMSSTESPVKHLTVDEISCKEKGNDCDELPNNRHETPLIEIENKMHAVIDHTDITNRDLSKDNLAEAFDQDNGDEGMRSKSDSFNKPPVAPKPKSKIVPTALPKPTAGSKITDSPKQFEVETPDKHKTDLFVGENDESRSVNHGKVFDGNGAKVKESPKMSKLPKIAHKSPKTKKSGIPASPLMRMKNSEKQTKQTSVSGSTSKQKLSESDSDVPLSPTTGQKHRPESPAIVRHVTTSQVGDGEKISRNRSSSPHARTSIPTSLKQRSNSPASKLPRAPNKTSPGSPSISSGQTSTPKPSGIVPPKKIKTTKDRNSPINEPSSPQSPDSSFDNTDDDQEALTSPKPNSQSNTPRLIKQNSQDGKRPKHGRSLLPVIHKTMDGTNGVSTSNKLKSGIPKFKSTRPLAPEGGEEVTGNGEPTLFQAIRQYTAQTDEELSFTKGTFVTELSDCDRVGWFVGMLADGTTGLYPADHFKPCAVSSESEA